MNMITTWSITLNLTNQKPIVMVGFNHKSLNYENT